MYKAFQNWCERLLRIPPDPLPPPGDEGTAQIFTAGKNFFRYLLFMWGLGTGITFLILSIALLGPFGIAITQLRKHGHGGAVYFLLIPMAALLLFIAQRLFSLAILRLDFDKRWYVVTNRSLRIREGVVNVREMTITFANIQNISVSQGPIQRALGIADLQVETAGGGGGGSHEGAPGHENLHTGWLRGIENANQVRELIQSRVKRHKDSGLGDHEETTHQTPLAASAEFVVALQEVHAEAKKLHEAITNHDR